MKKVNKKVILIIVFVIIISYIIAINFTKKDDKISKNSTIKIVTRVTENREFYIVKNILNNFYFNCSNINNPDEDIDINSETLLNESYNMLDDEYINECNISTNNFEEKIKFLKGNSIQINDMYLIQKHNNISLYIIYAEQLSYSSNNEQDKEIFLIKIDDYNNIYSIYLEDYIIKKGYNNLKIKDKIDIELTAIYNKKYNIYNNEIVYMNRYQEDLFNDYKNSCSFNIKRAYELLDESCKNETFKTYDEFLKYIKNKSSQYFTMKIKECSITENEEYREFKYTTNKDLTFTFKEIAPMKYTVIIH